MLYVQESLGPDEELVHVGQFNFMYTVQALTNVVWGMVASVLLVLGATFVYKQMGIFPDKLPFLQAIKYLHPGVRIGAFIVFAIGLLTYAQMMLNKMTTEIAITNNRLVYKRGFIARHVGEISIDRIESVNVLQTILGRMFNYGRLAVHGMGIGEVVLPPIEDPIAFRQAIERARKL